MNRLSETMRQVALGAHVALIGCVALRAPSALSVLMAALLLWPLRGMWQGRAYTCAWASMLVAFYVAAYLADGYARPEQRLGSFAIAAVAAVDYVALMLFVRFRGRETAAAAAAASAARTEASDDASR